MLLVINTFLIFKNHIYLLVFFIIIFLMIRIMHLLYTGNSSVVKDNFPITMFEMDSKSTLIFIIINDCLHRQLEAIIRISESLAKMRLAPFATDADVDEALRLFQVSTLDAAMSGSLSGMGHFSSYRQPPSIKTLFKNVYFMY